MYSFCTYLPKVLKIRKKHSKSLKKRPNTYQKS